MPQCQFLFSAIFCFRKATQEIFSELDVTKTKVPIFTVLKQKSERETKKGAMQATPCLGAAWPWPAPRDGAGPSGAHRPRLSAHIFYDSEKTLKNGVIIHEKFRSSAAIETKFRGSEGPFPAPCRDGD